MLELGTAKIDITPRFPVPLAGFATRTGSYDRVLSPLFARIFCFRSHAGAPIILISADLIWWGSERIESLREKIRAIRGAGNATVLLHATHNHSGPQTSEILSPEIGQASTAYLEQLDEAVLNGIPRALVNLEPVSTERGTADCHIGIHRRRLIDGSIQMAPNPDGPIDTECSVICFKTLSGSIKAVLVHFTCHPTTTAANSISAEFCGAAMTSLENELGDDVIAAYLQGCCGDIRPAMIRDDQFYRGDDEDVQRLGCELRKVVMNVLSRPMEPCQDSRLTSVESELNLFFENRPDTVSATLTMMKVNLAQNISFLTFNAEMVVAYGLFVKQRSHGACLPLGYSNGMIGYVTTERQLAEGGYEAREAFPYFGMPGPFTASTERRLRQKIEELLRVN